MRLDYLQVRQVRNLTDVQISPNTEVNIIYGENAAGKTALLESIYLLSKARSFRTAHIKEVIQHNKKELTVSGVITNHKNESVNTGIRKTIKETEIRYNGARIKTVSEQANNVIVLCAIPDNTKVLTGTPKDRRKWIDWALFHVEQNYLQVWHDYHQALRNRNALLRGPTKNNEFFVWENIMASTAEALSDMWRNYLICLQKYYKEVAGKRSYGNVVFSVRKDKYRANNFLEYLQATRQSDIKAGFTQQGPHKTDFEFKIQGKHVNTVFSGGQIKLFVTMLSITQAKLLKIEKGKTPIILVDDLTSELDKKTAAILLELLYEEKMQLFITTTELSKIHKSNKDISLFHVEHGRVKKC
ncbi:MAG: DNA replication and repair protein RecF [Proteobacteria bacterium]|nr:DNA replication and repair protein RecF [Pseudomonadota bacterium]